MIFSRRYTRKTDAALVTLVAKSDQGAFEELLNRHQKAVYVFAFCLLRNALDAEDISQEVFIRLYRVSGYYQSRARLRTYLLRITRNLCIDHIRKKYPETMNNLPETVCSETPFNRLYSAELGKQIEDVMSDLPERQRAAIHLRHVQDMSYQEIADTLDITIKAVESLLTRARRTFRKNFSIPN